MNEEDRTHDLPPQNIIVPSELASQTLSSKSSEIMFTQNVIKITKVNPNFGSSVVIVINPTIPFPTTFESIAKTQKEKKTEIDSKNVYLKPWIIWKQKYSKWTSPLSSYTLLLT